MGCEPWSWSQALAFFSPLNAVHALALLPLISMPGDQVAPPSADWLKKMGLFALTPKCVDSNRVHVMYTLSCLGLPACASAVRSSLSLKMEGSLSLATIPRGVSEYSWK